MADAREDHVIKVGVKGGPTKELTVDKRRYRAMSLSLSECMAPMTRHARGT